MTDKFDKNLSIENISFGNSLKTYTIPSEPFVLYGNDTQANNKFSRMPETEAKKISAGVADRAERCSGIRLRFKTNSKFLGLKVSFVKSLQFPSQTTIASKGFDIYVDDKYVVSVFPQEIEITNYETTVDLRNNDDKQVTVYFPYNAVIDKLYIGLEEQAEVTAPDEYLIKKPIVFYGSSITHGFCVSRPGNTFASIVSRKLNSNYINLGFSGVCHGELEMADYLAGIEKSALVCEFDHNEACALDLEKKHLPFYQRLREKDEKTPIILMSSPNRFYNGESMYERMEIVKKTVEYAKSIGDKNIYFVNGQMLYPDENAFDCSVDGIHPNDYGAFMIAQKLCDVLNGIELK